jgi:microcystin-dependent protein
LSTPYISEIRLFTFNFAPKGWAMCNGQLLPINQNQALFSLLGTTYGGDGRVNFALPNLQGRVPMHQGRGFALGQVAGETTHTLLAAEMPTHTHVVAGSPNASTVASPTGNYLATSPGNVYGPPPANTSLMPATLTDAGGGQPHDNMSPYLVLNFCIALQGIFPSQN